MHNPPDLSSTIWFAGSLAASALVWQYINAAGVEAPILRAVGAAAGTFATSGLTVGPLVIALQIVREAGWRQAEPVIVETEPEEDQYPELEKLPPGWRENARRSYASKVEWFPIGEHPTNPASDFDRQMYEFAQAYRLKQSLSPRRWGGGKPFSGKEFARLIEQLHKGGLVEYENPKSPRSGRVFTRAGNHVVRRYLAMTAPPQ